MNGFKLPAWMSMLGNRTVAAPLIIVLLLSMMILPLPALILDALFSFNIALSIMVLLIGLQTKKALDFIAF
ncbi:MAG TPA: FHIPEP family type III secretion protein, partial [Methylotenera sp.]|nr:FHIPEP family type III secretion protein [Methylotenera sp.]